MIDIDFDLVDEKLLPPQIRTYAKLIGIAETYVLLDAFGGAYVSFPVRPRGSTALNNLLSLPAREALCKRFGGQEIELPKKDKILLQIRNIAIREMRKTQSGAKTARAFNLTRRHVINIATEEDENPTVDMFHHLLSK